ncbi:MAG: hypothetical protein HY854_02575 [Burkholderiales bacterium]|nr:hypothetical protein [Burkholderiales bacterium]
MAITANERGNILELLVLMFDATPGGYLDDVVAVYEAVGHNLAQLANLLGSTPAFQSLHPNFQTADEFATDFLSTVGLEGDVQARQWVIANFNAGLTKAQIMMAGWNYLDNLPVGAAAQYVVAAEIMHNKAEVSLYYSVTTGGGSLDLGELQSIIANVDETQASVDAAIDAIDDDLASGPILTVGQDNIHIFGDDPVNITGVVDGDADDFLGNGQSTYSAGDTIIGNNNTNLNLTVVEGGNAQFAQVQNMEAVNIYAATNGTGITFNAAAWENIGVVSLNDGVDGLAVFLNNLDAGIDMQVMNVTGSMSASIDTDNGNLYVRIANLDEGTEGILAQAEADGNVTISGVDMVSASIFDNNGVSLGDVMVTMGNTSYFGAFFSDDAAIINGTLDVTLGDSSTFSFSAWDLDKGGMTVGAIDVTAGDNSFIDISVTDSNTGTVDIGGISAVAGNSSTIELFISSDASSEEFNVALGNVNMTAGDSASIDMWVGIEGEDLSGQITAGMITAVAGDSSSVSITFDGYAGDNAYDGGVSVDGVSVMMGDSSYAYVNFETFTAASIGDVDITFGDWGTATLTVTDMSTADVGDVTITGGIAGSAFAYFYDMGELNLGNVSMSVGDAGEDGEDMVGGYVSLSLWEVGAATVGDVTLSAGVSGSAYFYAWGTGDASTLTVGDVSLMAGGDASVSISDHNSTTLGNVTVHGGAAATNWAGGYFYVEGVGTDSEITIGDIDVAAEAGNAYASVDNWLDGAGEDVELNAGAVTVGNVSVVAGDDAEAFFYVWQNANGVAYTTEEETPTLTNATMGDVTVGNVSLMAGNVSSIDATAGASFSIENYANTGMAGNLTVGDVTLEVGNGFVSGTLESNAYAWVGINQWGGAGAGDLTVGDISLTGGDFADLSVSITGYAWNSGAAMGNFTVGDVSFVGGESAYVQFDAWWAATDAGEDGGATVGDMTVGVVSVDVAQDATISISITHSIDTYTADFANSIGTLTVGGVDVVAGDNANVDIDILQYVSYSSQTDTVEGDMVVGDISVSVSATETEDLSGGSNIDVSISRSVWYNDAGAGGDLTIGDITLAAAGNSADIDLDIYHHGSWATMGNTNVGVIAVTAANDASIDVYGYIYNAEDGEVGDVMFEGFVVNVGDDGDVDFHIDAYLSNVGGTGNISLGNMDINVGESTDVDFMFHYYATDGNDVESFTIGTVNVVAGDGSTVAITDIDMYEFVVQDIGNVTLGKVTASLGEGAEFSYSPTIQAYTGTIGDVSVGGLDATVGEGAYLQYSVEVTASDDIGDVTIGDLSVVAETSAEVDLTVSVSSTVGSLGAVAVGNVDVELGYSATMTWASAGLYFYAGVDIDGVTVGNVSMSALDGAVGSFSITAEGEDIGTMVVGDIELNSLDDGVTFTTAETAEAPVFEVGGRLALWIESSSTADNALEVGDVTIAVEGEHADDEVWLYLESDGDVTIGDVTVSGAGLFILDGNAHTGEDNTSFISVVSGGDITIGDIDFSGYENDITLNLSWTDAGAANITGGEGDDVIYGNAGNNIITGSEGQDDIDISQGGKDTVSYQDGDSGTTAATVDIITGFNADDSGAFNGDGDKLDFNLVAGSAGNFVKDDNSSPADMAAFIQDANDALNSTVKYYVDTFGGNTYIAVNYGTGEADLIVQITGTNAYDELTFANIIA